MEIPAFFTNEFAPNFEHLLQQETSLLSPCVLSTQFQGRRKKFNQIDRGSMQEITTRKGDTPDGDTTGKAYWIYRRIFEFVKSWDEYDEVNLGEVVLPTSDEMQSAAMAYHRTQDLVVSQAFDAARFVGENGTDTDALPASQDIAVNYVPPGGTPANSGLTVEKIIHAAGKMNKSYVPKADRFLIHTQQQLSDMLNTTKITNGDYVQVKALVDGKVDTFMGFKFVQYEELPVVSNVRQCYAIHKGGIKFADIGKRTYLDPRPDKRHGLQLRVSACMGATRTENERVVRLYCSEAA